MMERLLKIKLKKETVTFVLVCVGAVIVFTIFVKITDSVVYAKKAEGVMKKAFAQNQQNQQPEVIDKLIEPSQGIADNLKRRNAFNIGMAQRQIQFPVSMVNGIFGSEALINDRWYKQGDQIGEAVLVAIEPTQVRIKWQDDERIFVPITNEIPQQPTGRGTTGRGRGSGPMGGQAAQTFVSGFSQQDMQQMMQQAENMRQQFMNMSDQQRMDAANQMMNQFGQGGFGGGRGGMGGGMGGGGRGGMGGGGGRGGAGGGGGGRGGGGGGGGRGG